MWIAGHPGASDVGRWMSGGPWKRMEVGTRGLKGGRFLKPRIWRVADCVGLGHVELLQSG